MLLPVNEMTGHRCKIVYHGFIQYMILYTQGIIVYEKFSNHFYNCYLSIRNVIYDQLNKILLMQYLHVQIVWNSSFFCKR